MLLDSARKTNDGNKCFDWRQVNKKPWHWPFNNFLARWYQQVKQGSTDSFICVLFGTIHFAWGWKQLWAALFPNSSICSKSGGSPLLFRPHAYFHWPPCPNSPLFSLPFSLIYPPCPPPTLLSPSFPQVFSGLLAFSVFFHDNTGAFPQPFARAVALALARRPANGKGMEACPC